MEALLLIVLIVLMLIVLSDLGRIKRSLNGLSEAQVDLKRKLRALLANRQKDKTPEPASKSSWTAPVPSVSINSPAPPPSEGPTPPAPTPQGMPIRPLPAPAAPAKPSPIVETAIEILRKIWQWILVGEEYRPAGVSMEYAVATTWLIRAGIIAIVTCIGYFLKWSIDRNLLGPETRIGVSLLVGLGLLISGIRLLGRKWHLLGQGFIGGGIAIFYFSVFAAGILYKLVPNAVAFGLMILITLSAGVLSVWLNSLLAAILGIVGGYATPVLLRTEQPNLLVFYTYLLLLGLGILGIARSKPWRLLNYLGFVFTYALFLSSLPADRHVQFPLIITFLSLFFVLHSSLVFLYNISRRVRATGLEILHLLLNAAVYAGLAYGLIREVCGRPYPAIMTLSLSLFFILHVWVFLRRGVADRALRITFLALAALFATLTMPLAVERESLTISWSLLALTFLWIGSKLDNPFLRRAGHVLYLLVFARMTLLDIPHRFDLGPMPRIPLATHLHAMADRLWTFGISIGSIFTAFFMERRMARKVQARASEDGTSLQSWDAAMTPALYWFLALFLFAYAQLETFGLLGYFPPLRQPALTLLWCAMAAHFMQRYFATRHAVMLGATLAFAAVAVMKTFLVDMGAWRVGSLGFFETAHTPLTVCMRWIDFGGVLSLLATAWVLFSRPLEPRRLQRLFGYGGLILLFVYLSLETRSFLYWRVREFLEGGASVLWALFAVGFLVGGISKDIRTLRFAGLGLFAVVLGKVFLVDLAGMPTIYRVIAFMAVGVFLLVGAFAYIRARQAFDQESES